MSESFAGVKSIFSHAMELRSAAEREAYLAHACGNDDRLRAEVESLLLAAHDAGEFLDGLWLPLEETADEVPAAERPGTAIGPYKLLEQIGEGGFGVVYVADQERPVRRKVALKVIKPGMDTKEVIARFEVERQALALMDHPNIAKVHDAGMTDQGRPFFVMEFVRGFLVTSYCDRARLGIRERLGLFVQICQAVQHAHQKGIIHRDLKPSNVLVTEHDGTPVAKVIDFGVAKAIGQQLTDKTLHTRFMQLVGSPLYMSPEQAGLSGLDVDTRADIYALGVLLYELLTGHTPFDKERFRRAEYDEVRRIIREEEPPKPSSRLSTLGQAATTVSVNRGTDPRRLNRLCRGELDWIVMKALEKDRNRRYETANGFATDVQRYLADEPVLAGPPSASYRLRKFVQRNRVRVAIVGLLLFFVMLLIGGVGWAVRDRAARQAEAAHQASKSLSRARTWIGENKLTSARQELAEAKGRIGADRTAHHELLREIETLEAELEKFESFLALIDQAHEAEIPRAAEAALLMGTADEVKSASQIAHTPERDPAKAAPFLLNALAVYGVGDRNDWLTVLEASLMGPDQVRQVRRSSYEELLWLADDVTRRRVHHRTGHRLSPAEAARQGLAYLHNAEPAFGPTSAWFRLRARCHNLLGAEEAASADLALAKKTEATIAMDHYLLGLAANDARDKEQAVKHFEAALRAEPTHYWSLMRLGYCLTDLGRQDQDFAGAVTAFTGCILNRPDHAHAYYCRGNALYKLQRYPEALADLTKAIELRPDLAQAWNGRGIIHAKSGKMAEAIADFSKAIELQPDYAQTWHNRGTAHAELRQHHKAISDHSNAIGIKPDFVQSWCSRAAAHYSLRQYDMAIADLSKAIELQPQTESIRVNRGAAYAALRQYDNALADYSKAIELNSANPEAWFNRGNAHKALRQYEKAIADYSRAVEIKPDFAVAWENRGVVYCEDSRQFDKAIADFSKAIEADPRRVSAWYNRGNAHRGLGQFDQAIADYSKAIEITPVFAAAWLGRGNVRFKLNQYDLAIADYSKAIELEPDSEVAWYDRGLAHMRLHQYDNALSDYSRAIELKQAYPQAWSNRGAVRARLKQHEEAVRDFREALRLKPDFAVAASNLAKSLDEIAWPLVANPDAKSCDTVRAVSLANEAVQLVPKVGAYWETLGIAHYRARDWKASRTALEQSKQLSPDSICLLLFLAMANWQLNDKETARTLYEQAVSSIEKNKDRLAKVERHLEQLPRFRAEAAKLMGIEDKKD
jgi:tetratricopeptide (TPR) repeat protein/serine/threonine protein kinase